MNKTELLGKINDYTEMLNRNKENEERLKFREIDRYTERIVSLIPRMRDLFDIVSALYDNSIINDDFITNGISHNLGFFTDSESLNKLIIGGMVDGRYSNKPAMKFGVKGGGCLGYDLVVDLNDETDNPIKYGRLRENKMIELKYGSYYHIEYLKKVVKEFDSFENRLSEYVSNLI